MFISNGIKIYSPIILILIIADIICIYQSMKLLKLSNLGKLNKNKITSKQYPVEFEELYKKIFLKNNSEIEKLRIKVRNISALYLLFLVLTFLFVIFGIFIVPFILNSLDIYINGIIYHTLFLLGAYICGYRSLMLFGKYKKEMPIYKNSFKENVISKIVPLVNSNLLYFNGNDIAINIEPEYRASGFDGYDYNSFKVDDAYIFMQNLTGTLSKFDTTQITDYLRSMVLSGISDAIGESKIAVLDMAANLQELSRIVETKVADDFKSIGLTLTNFVFESFSLPEELEKALDKNTSLGMLRGNMDVYTQMETLAAMKEAAKNPGAAGGTMGAGMGLGMGMGLGNIFANNMQNMTQMNSNTHQQNQGQSRQCPNCNALLHGNPKFCPECGSKLSNVCPNCGTAVKANAKFCPECGTKLK